MEANLYGIAEIATAVGADRYTVAQWHKRGKLPPPSQVLAMGPAWTAETIEPWIAERRHAAMTQRTVATCQTLEVARALQKHLVAKGLSPVVLPADFSKDPALRDERAHVRVPVQEHVPALQVLDTIVNSDTGAALEPPTVYYLHTSDRSRFVRISLSPTTECQVVTRPEWTGVRFGHVNALGADLTSQARSAAEVAGLKLRSPNSCNAVASWSEME